MQRFKQYITEQFKLPEKPVKFNKWVKPSKDNIALEYKVEYMFHTKHSYGDIFPTLEDFETAVNNGKVVNPNKLDVGNTTDFNDIDGLFDMISGYRSYPEFRNEKTFQAVIDGFAKNKPMNMSIIIKSHGNHYTIMSGNTRLNIANILGIEPKAVVIEAK